MSEQRELGARKSIVLRAVVEEYVRTGEPVGSETIAEDFDLGVSPATIRNEMAALEELGYLSHPHTSAGRVPTDLGYRHFVNSLPTAGKLREAQRRAITEFFAETVFDLEAALRGTTQLLSKLTRYAGLALPPNVTEERVVHVEFVSLGSVVLALVVGGRGNVDKRVLDRPEGLEDDDLARINARSAEAFGGITVDEAVKGARRMALEGEGSEGELLGALADMLEEVRGGGAAHVLVGGVANLAGDAAEWRKETTKHLFDALERESEMLDILREASIAEDLSVMIGTEHPSTERWDAAVVAAPYRSGATSLGTVGVVGPTRMDYLTVITAVRAVARRISELATALDV